MDSTHGCGGGDLQPSLLESERSEEVADRKRHVRSKRVFRKAVAAELYPSHPEDMVAPDNVARLVLRVVSRLDLSSLRLSYADCGGVAYDPASMLAVMVLGYALGISSAREMEDRCLYDVRFMLVARGARPDYRTIARFRLRLEPVIDEFFRQILEACREEKILRLERVSLDGTKIRSAASQWKRWIMDEDRALIAEAGLVPPEASDADARVVRSPKGFLLGYNAQAMVDMDTGVVVAGDVFQSSPDQGLLGPMLERAKALTGEVPQQLVADAGYDSHESYQACKDAGVDAVIARQDDTALFWTAVSETEIVCPMGKPASNVRASVTHEKPSQTYSVSGCKKCVFFGSCCSSRHGRSVVVPTGMNPVLRVLNAHQARSPQAKEAMVRRFASIEPVFGRLKGNKQLTRFRLRGLSKVRLEFVMTILAENALILGKALQYLLWLLLSRAIHLLEAGPRLCKPRSRTNPVQL